MRILLSGEIDISVRSELHDVLRAAVAGSGAVTEVDLRDVTFVDCAAIGELVGAYLDAQRQGQILVVTRPRGFVREVLEFANVLPLLTTSAIATTPCQGGATSAAPAGR